MAKSLTAVVLIGLVAASSATSGGRSLQQLNLVSDAESLLGNAVNTVESGLTTLVTDLFGAANSFATQIPSDIKNLSWDNLVNLDISTPVKSFLASISNITLPTSLLEAEEKVTEFIDQFCTKPKFLPSEQIPSNCVGKQLIVRLAPWSCSLYDNKTIACNPPFIEVIKKPAVCSAKYESAAIFTGKQCRLAKDIGATIVKTIGGDPFSLDIPKNLLDIPHEIASSLLPSVFDAPATASPPSSISASASGSVSVGRASANVAASGVATNGR